jgi:hypothetical protein
MRVRKLETVRDPVTGVAVPTYDMTFGKGQQDYFLNDPNGVGQLVLTRLEMGKGEWFLDTTDGTPWRLKVLGRRTEATRDAAIRARVLATQGVKAINTYASQVNRQARSFGAQIMIDTIYSADAIGVPTGTAQDIDVRNGR